jgi:hypothetical protein
MTFNHRTLNVAGISLHVVEFAHRRIAGRYRAIDPRLRGLRSGQLISAGCHEGEI